MARGPKNPPSFKGSAEQKPNWTGSPPPQPPSEPWGAGKDPLTFALSRLAMLVGCQAFGIIAACFVLWDVSWLTEHPMHFRFVGVFDVFYFGLIYTCIKVTKNDG